MKKKVTKKKVTKRKVAKKTSKKKKGKILTPKEAKEEARKIQKEMKLIHKVTTKYISQVSKIVKKHHPEHVKGLEKHIETMKKKVKDEAARRKLKHNLKLGAGGIRQIEFTAQMFQLIRAGKERQFKTQALMVAIKRLMGAKLIAKKEGSILFNA